MLQPRLARIEPGALRQAAEALLHEARDETAFEETRRVAELALSRLYSLGLEYDA